MMSIEISEVQVFEATDPHEHVVTFTKTNTESGETQQAYHRSNSKEDSEFLGELLKKISLK